MDEDNIIAVWCRYTFSSQRYFEISLKVISVNDFMQTFITEW